MNDAGNIDKERDINLKNGAVISIKLKVERQGAFYYSDKMDEHANQE